MQVINGDKKILSIRTLSSQVLPTLVDDVPEARINIALYHLNRGI